MMRGLQRTMVQCFIWRHLARCCSVLAALACTAVNAHAQRSPDIPPPSIADRVRIDTRRPIDFHATVWPDTVYVNQQVYYQVGVFLGDAARSRLAGNPEFLPPEFRGMIAYEINSPRRRGYREVAGTNYDAHVFHRAVFPVAPGSVVVPAPQLTYKLRSSSSYFSRENSTTVRAESAHVVVRPLPMAGKPVDFTGAVGRFRSASRMSSDSLRVGEPVVFTLRVEGIGNIKLLSRPLLEVPWASVVQGSERLSVDTSGMLVRGAKEFDWILTPSVDGAVELPAVRYSYFDPYAATYDVALSEPVPMAVAPGTIVDTEEASNAVLLPLRESIEPPGLQVRARHLVDALPLTVWLVLIGIAPLPALGMFLLRTSRVAREERPAVVLDSLATLAARERATARVDDPSHAARSVRRALHHALAARLGARIQQLTDRRYVARLLRRRGATRETVAATMQLLDRLDRAGFAHDAGTETAAYASAAAELFQRIERETLAPGTRGGLRSRQLSAAFLLSWQLGADGAISVTRTAPVVSDSALRADFDAARDAYTQRKFVEATSRFAALAEQAPEAVDVLTNWGTAAWAQGDTVDAVVAWHRAAHRNPIATDVQERLLLLPPGARGGVADLPLVSPAVLFVVAVGSWVAGWLLLAMLTYRRRFRPAAAMHASSDALRVTAWVLVVFGGAAGASALYERIENDPRRLYVVTRPETMRTQSGTDSDALGGVATGDIVKRMSDDGDWLQVKHTDGRSGWLPAARLVQLDPPSAQTD